MLDRLLVGVSKRSTRSIEKAPYKPTGPAEIGPVKGKFRGLQTPIHRSFPAGWKSPLPKRLSSQVISGTPQTPWYHSFRNCLQRTSIIELQAGLFGSWICTLEKRRFEARFSEIFQAVPMTFHQIPGLSGETGKTFW